MFKKIDFNNFINVELPFINIHCNLKERICNASNSTEQILVMDTEEGIDTLLKLARGQYKNKDNKWILTYARYTHKMGHKLLSVNQHGNAADYFLDSTTLSLLELEKALRWNMLNQLKLINSCLEDRAMDYISSKICIFFERYKRIINIGEVKNLLKSDLHNLAFLSSKKIEEQINCAYLIALKNFTSMLSVSEIITIVEGFIALNNSKIFNYTRNVIREKFRETRKSVFKDWIPSLNLQKSEEVGDLIKLIECSVKINNLLGEKKDSLIDESELYKFKAYLTTDSKTASEFFDRSIENLKIVRKTFPETREVIKREIIFTVARKFEYLAALESDKNNRIKFLSKAEYFYGLLHSAASYYLKFIIYYFILTEIIYSEENPDKISVHCVKIIKEFPDAEKFWKVPFLKTLHKVVETLAFWCSDPNDKKIFDLMQKASIMLASSDFIKSTFQLTLSFCLVSALLKTQAEVLRIYFTDILRDLVKKQKIDIAALTNHIHYIEDADSKEILQQIIKEEGQELEFKGSFRFDVVKFFETSNKESSAREEEALLKSIVGFLNSRGGKIIVGLLEKSRFEKYASRLKHLGDKLILGINFEYGEHGYDRYSQALNDKIRDRIDINLVSQLIIRKHTVDRLDILEINVPSTIGKGKLYYLDDIFYVRENNQTVKKEGKDLIDYIQNLANRLISGMA